MTTLELALLGVAVAAMAAAAWAWSREARARRELVSQRELLVARAREVAKAGKQKAEFMANVTHELRTPIHGICGMVDLVCSGAYGSLTEKQTHTQQQIKRSATGLLRLVDDLLRLSQAEAGKLTFHPQKLVVTELVDQAVSATTWMVGTRDLTVRAEAEPDLPALLTDRGKLNHVLMNLLSNAVKFTEDPGEVVLRARAIPSGVAFEVADTGVGIPEDKLGEVFDAFAQIDGGDDRSFGGMGLGLALSRRLVNLLGGKLEVASEPGRGTTFTVSIPLQPQLFALQRPATGEVEVMRPEPG